MSRSFSRSTAGGLPPLAGVHRWMIAALALLSAVGAGLLVVRLSMSPSGVELRELAIYLAAVGAATMLIGWFALGAADRIVALSLPARAFAGAAVGSAAGLLHVVVVARLMFVNTGHDLRLLVALVVSSGFVTAFFSLWVASAVAGRVRSITDSIGRLASGDYDIAFDGRGGDELAALAADVNRLAERLREAQRERAALDEQRRELTAGISHDLRTPLGSVRAMVEALEDGIVDSEAERQRYYDRIQREIGRLDGMIGDLMELAQIDAGALRLQRRSVALEEVAAEVVDAMQARASRRGVRLTLRVEGDPSPAFPLDGTRMERAVANLVRNALEHTPDRGRIDVVVRGSDGSVTLSVEDTGEGISTTDLPRVWERFYRGERSPHSDGGGAAGTGLGLAIVRGIVEAHGGTVDAQSSPGAGSVLTIRLPTAVEAGAE